MFQLLMPAQLFAGLSQLTKVSLGLSVGTLTVTFNVVGTFNPSILNISRHIHPHSITVGTFTALNIYRHIHSHSITVGTSNTSISVGTSIHTQYPSAHSSRLDIRRHIHPDSITIGTSIHIRYPSAHSSPINRCRHIRTTALILRRHIHSPSISVGTYIYLLYIYRQIYLYPILV